MTRCKKHPRYRGIRQPRVACAACWQLFFGICQTCINVGCQQWSDQADEEPEADDAVAGQVD